MELGTEAALCAAAREGDREAFRELYVANVGIVLGYLGRRCGRDLAEELTAETFCRAWERRAQFEWRGVRYRAWLLRIAVNLATSRARARREVPVEADVLDAVAAGVPGPESTVCTRDALERVRAVVAGLPATQRTVLDLRFAAGLDTHEVAHTLGTTPEAVRATTYRALRAVRARLDA